VAFLVFCFVQLIIFRRTIGKRIFGLEIGWLAYPSLLRYQKAPLRIVFYREGLKLLFGWNINIPFFVFSGGACSEAGKKARIPVIVMIAPRIASP